MKGILNVLNSLRNKRKYKHDTLYCLYGIKPIEEDINVLDECTVTK